MNAKPLVRPVPAAGSTVRWARLVLRTAALSVCGALLCQPALAASTERVSVSSGGAEADSGSSLYASVISANGRFVAFHSDATNLVPNDTNGNYDVFVHDRLTGTTERVSIDSIGNQAVGNSYRPSISASGRFVAFHSDAVNLVPGDTNDQRDVFVRDRLTGTTERVSIGVGGAQGDDWSIDPTISADGRFVAFGSAATNLVTADANAVHDVFVRDRLTGTTERISVGTGKTEGNNGSYGGLISANGRFVAFWSIADNLVLNDTNGQRDTFVHDRSTGTTERISVDSSGNEGVGGNSFPGSISADGRFVTFSSKATNLVADDTNGADDIFLRDRSNSTTERVSIDSAGGQANGASHYPSGSRDGRFVVFRSAATNLVAGDTNGNNDIFLHDRLTGITERVSLSSAGAEANAESDDPSLSASGRFVAFKSQATNLVAGDTDGGEKSGTDIFVRNLGPLPDGSDDLAIDFGGAGLWQFLHNATWQKIHNASPLAVATGDLDGSFKDEVIASFAGAGLWARYDNATWTKLHNASPTRFVSGDLNGNGNDELIVDFGAAGLWVLYDNATWVKRHNATTQDLAVGDLDGNGSDELIVDFGGAGLWAFYNNTTWVKLHNSSPVHIATGDLDDSGREELIADFGAAGILARFNNSAWQKLHNGTSQGLTVGDLDGNDKQDLVVDFGAAGVWVRYNNATWQKRHNSSPMRMLATDLDGNGKAEAVLDFGAAGLWVRYNDTNWVKLHPAATQGLAAGGVD